MKLNFCSKYLVLIMTLFLPRAFASDAYEKIKASFVDSPSDLNKEEIWLEPYDETYLPKNVCENVSNIEVVKLEEIVKNYREHPSLAETATHIGLRDFLGLYKDSDDANTCLVSIIRVTYNVTCSNKLKYEGKTHLFSAPLKMNVKTCLIFEPKCQKFESQAYDEWIERPLDYLSDVGVYYNENTPDFKNYGIFSKKVLKDLWTFQKVAYCEWKYTGVPGKKLARPVLFIHGLNDDYETWGVESIVEKGDNGEKDKGDEKFQNGLVKKYKKESAPDLLAQSQNIDATEKKHQS